MTKRAVDDLGPGYRGPARTHLKRATALEMLFNAAIWAVLLLILLVAGWAIVAFAGWVARR